MQQHARCRAQQQVLARHFAVTAALVDDRTQHGKQLGLALHFVQDHQLMAVGLQEGLGVIQLALGRGQLQIQIVGIGVLAFGLERQCGLACLARAQ